MEMRTTCDGCGAQLSAGMRFCRRCGRPSPYLNETSVTESTTQMLPRAAGVLPIEEAAPLAPAYQAPLQNLNSTGATTRRLESNKPTSNVKQRSGWIVYWPVLFFIVCALVAVVFLKPHSQTERVVIVHPPDGFAAAPPAIPHIEAPQAPPANGSRYGDSSDALVYPNAQITMRVNRAGEGRVLQMSTTDALDAVADWYISKLKPTRVVREKYNVVLDAGQVKTVITYGGNKTEIILHQTGTQ